MAGLDMTMLQLLKHRTRFSKLAKVIKPGVLSDQTTLILKDYETYFAQHQTHDTIVWSDFFLWFKLVHPKLDADKVAIYESILCKITSDPPPEVEMNIVNRLHAAYAASELERLVKEWDEGDVSQEDFTARMQAINEEYELSTKTKGKNAEVMDSIEDMLDEDENDTGLHWRLPELNRSIRPLRGGDFIIVAGRPDKGKTTFLTCELTYMAKQVDDLYPGEGRRIYWFNNEGPGKRIKYRCYQSALNASTTELIAKRQAGTMHTEYEAAVGGRANVIGVFDIHDWWNYEVIDAIQQGDKSALIVLDMVDNIRFGGAVSNAGQRTDQLLEAMYQWARMLAVKLDVPIIATSQISAEGDGLSYPTLAMLKDSRTGKQGAAEVIITIGALNEITMEDQRFIGCTKNKLHKEGGPKDPRAQVTFDGLRGRFVSTSGL
jgi:replicative DNA helicase